SVGYSHLTVHMNAMGYAPHTVALAITVSGMALMLGKVGYGWATEHLGSGRSNWLFGALLVAGVALCCVCAGNTALLYGTMCVYGLGLAFTTVGMTAWAGDWSGPGQYDDTVRRFQIGYSGGTMLFSSLPGVLADRAHGSYRPAYILFLLCAVFVLAAVQVTYHKKRG
ncbi:MAG: MFS transporter, partial [Lachnospiraceae bacterium]|nr:MFS transporter [Lachnospiraceae bacterium]